MTREEFWMQVYMASFNEFHDSDNAQWDADHALTAYDEALKKYDEALKLPSLKVDWPEGSLGWAIQRLQLGDEFKEKLRRKETGRFPDYTEASDAVYKELPLIHPCDANALDWEVVE